MPLYIIFVVFYVYQTLDLFCTFQVLRKGQEQNLKNYNRKEISDLKLEDLVVFKKKLENLQNDLEKKRVVLKASLSLLSLSKSKSNKY